MSEYNLDHSTVDMFLQKPLTMYDLMKESYKFEYSDYDNYEMFRSELGIFLYWIEDNKPVGMCHGRATKDGAFKIIKLEWAVLPKHRGKGIAKKLAEETIEQMAKWGIQMDAPFDLVQVDMEPGNIHSIQVAKDLGLTSCYEYHHNGIDYLTYGDIIQYE